MFKCVRKSKKGHLIVLYWKKTGTNQVFKNDSSVNTINCIQLYIFHILDNIQKVRKLIMKESNTLFMISRFEEMRSTFYSLSSVFWLELTACNLRPIIHS